MKRLAVHEFISLALECSLYVAPKEPGLTHQEVVEIGDRLEFKPGEISDQFSGFHSSFEMDGERYLPTGAVSAVIFALTFEDDPRNAEAADFVLGELRELAREVGGAKARMGRNALVARGQANGYEAHDLEVAIAIFANSGMMQLEEGDVVFRSYGGHQSQTFAEQAAQARRRPRPHFKQVLEVVRDVTRRRGSDRPRAIEPIRAFQELLEPLGYKNKFGEWWAHTAREFRMADPAHQPTCCLVLAAALAEGALALICRHAHSTGTTMTKRIKLEEPTQWKFRTLVKAAKFGPDQEDRLLDDDLATRCLKLNERRQTIHVGRLIADYEEHPTPDIRPDEAREARHTLDALLRRILDWYERNPVKNDAAS